MITVTTKEEQCIAAMIQMAVNEGRHLSSIERAICKALAQESVIKKAIMDMEDTLVSGYWDKPLDSAIDGALGVLDNYLSIVEKASK